MKARFTHLTFLFLFTTALHAAEPIRVLVWDEQQPQQKQAYGDRFLGETIAAHLEKQPGFSVKNARLDDAEQGLSDDALNATDGCFDILWEDNVFGPSVGQGHANVPVQSGHQNAGERGEEVPTYPSGRFVLRNNLFVGLKGEAAFGFQGPDTSLLYNNVFYRNETKPSLITITDDPGSACGPALNLFCFNNLFAANGDLPFYRQRNAPASLANLKTAHNLYSHANGGDVKITAEAGALIAADESFVAPAIPVFDFAKGTEQIRRAREGFQLKPTSPARGAGIDPLSFTGEAHPKAIPEMRAGLAFPCSLASPPVPFARYAPPVSLLSNGWHTHSQSGSHISNMPPSH